MTPRKKSQQGEGKARAKEEAAGAAAGPEGQDGTARVEEPEQESVAPSPEQVIEALGSELAELEDRYLRLVAEFDNFRKRTIRERAQQEERAQAELVKRLLESLDDLSRVSELGSTEHDAAVILEGVQLVEAKLRRALEQFGLKAIEAVGQPFNPELHEAMITVATDRPEENEVVSQELAKGYLFKDTLLRPSLVEVKMYRPEPEAESVDSGETEGQS
jgi:molecular chaperone GrpE